jgi:hypothetical protein
MQQKIAAILLLLFVDSAMQHGGGATDSAEVQSAGVLFAEQRAGQVASQLLANTRERILGTDPAEATEVVVRALGPNRASDIAATETTVATSAGGERAVVLTVGTSVMDLWITEQDGKVCPICAPLHEAKRDVWERQFPMGPPGHPNCRCWISYEFERN